MLKSLLKKSSFSKLYNHPINKIFISEFCQVNPIINLNYFIKYSNIQQRCKYFTSEQFSKETNTFNICNILILNLYSYSNAHIFLDKFTHSIIECYIQQLNKAIIDSRLSNSKLIKLISYFFNTCKYFLLSELFQIASIHKSERVLYEFSRIPQIRQCLDSLQQQIIHNKSSVLTQLQCISCLQFFRKQTIEIYLKNIIPHIYCFKNVQIILLCWQLSKLKDINYPFDFLQLFLQNQNFKNLQKIRHNQKKYLFLKSLKHRYSSLHEINFISMFKYYLTNSIRFQHEQIILFLKLLEYSKDNVMLWQNKLQLDTCVTDVMQLISNFKLETHQISNKLLLQLFIRINNIIPSGELLFKLLTSRINNECNKLILQPKFDQMLNIIFYNSKKMLSYSNSYCYKQYTNQSLKLFGILFNSLIKIGKLDYILKFNNLNDLIQAKIIQPNNISLFLDDYLKKNQIIKNNKDFIDINKNQIKLLISFWFDNKLYLNNSKRIILNISIEIINKQLIIPQNFKIIYYLICLLSEIQQKSLLLQSITVINKIYYKLQKILQEKLYQKNNGFINTNSQPWLWMILSIYKIMISEVKPVKNNLIIQFINTKLIYSLGYLKWLQSFQMINFFYYLHDIYHDTSIINQNVFQICYDSLNSCILYVQAQNKYYLNEKYKNYYQQLIKLAIQKRQIFKYIKNQSFLLILQNIWCKCKKLWTMTNIHFINFLQIFQNPEKLISKLVREVKQTQFSQQILSTANIHTLKLYGFINQSIKNYLEKNSTNIEKEIFQFNDSFLSRKNIYLEMITNRNIDIQLNSLIPQPQTNSNETLLIYCCCLAYQKIRSINDFNMKSALNFLRQGKQIKYETIIFSFLRKYVTDKLLMQFSSFNDFQLDNQNLAKQHCYEVWKKYQFVRKDQRIEQYKQNKSISSDFYLKIMKAILGNQDKTKDILKKFSYHSPILIAASSCKFEFNPSGALVQIWKIQQPQKKIYFVCTNKYNYKIFYICTQILYTNQFDICIIDENTTVKEIIEYIEMKFQNSTFSHNLNLSPVISPPLEIFKQQI